MAPTDEEKRKNVDGNSTNERPKKRVNKPLIEKRRRERINECLNQLQTLISQLDKDNYKVGRPAKLEKADILEMTVEFVKKTKANLPVSVQKTKENNDVHDQSYMAGYRKCMDEIQEFCKKNNIPDDVKASLHCQIDSKINQIKTEEKAVDLTIKLDKGDAKFNELQLTNNNPVIQPKHLPQIPNSNNNTPMAQVQIIQRPMNTNGQVTVVCQKEPPTYVLVPAAALCQPIQIPSANPNFPLIVQNSATNYEVKSNFIDRTGQVFPASNSLSNSGQLVMLPSSSLSVPVVNTNFSPSISRISGYKLTSSEPIVTSSPIYPALSTSFTKTLSLPIAPSTQAIDASGSTTMMPSVPLLLPNQSSKPNDTVQEENVLNDDMWRPW